MSLYDIKPPISKAKMTAITKAAMKSVKFYKHVVHGVEKFILKVRLNELYFKFESHVMNIVLIVFLLPVSA